MFRLLTYSINTFIESRCSAIGIGTGYVLDPRGVGVRFTVGSGIFILYVVQTGSGVHQFPLQLVPAALSP
jgi:hypothetical protein